MYQGAHELKRLSDAIGTKWESQGTQIFCQIKDLNMVEERRIIIFRIQWNWHNFNKKTAELYCLLYIQDMNNWWHDMKIMQK